MKRLISTLGCAVVLSLALSPNASSAEIAAGVGADFLDSGFRDWQHSYVRGAFFAHNDVRIRAEARRFERFNLVNTELSTGLTWTLTPRYTIDLEVGTTPSADFRPDNRYKAELYRNFDWSGGIGIGAEHQQWANSNSTSYFIEPDLYRGNFRYALRFSQVNLSNANSSLNTRATMGWYYGDLSYVNVVVADGREIDVIGTTVISSNVRSVAMYGRHHLRRAWSFEYALSYTQQGNFYNRTGIEIGLHYKF